MLKEFKYQIKQKYLLILLLMLTFVLFAAFSMANENNGNVDKDFSYDIEEYTSINQIKARYDALQTSAVSGYSSIVTEGITEEKKNYYSQLYQFIIDNDLPYDSLVEFEDASYSGFRKHTQFHIFGESAYFIMMFMIMSIALVGSVVPTIDFTKKTAKLVYTSGLSKKRVLLRKYGVSLISLVSLELIIEVIAMFVSLIWIKSGAQYSYILLGNKLYFLNFTQFVLIHILHNLIMCVVFYSIVFFFSFLCKNTIISTIVVFALMLSNSMITIKFSERWLECVYYMPTSGIFYLVGDEYTNTPSYMLLGLIYVFVAIMLCIGALKATKKFDFSR